MKASDWLSAVMKQYIMTYNYISFKTRFTILTVTNELETRLQMFYEHVNKSVYVIVSGDCLHQWFCDTE